MTHYQRLKVLPDAPPEVIRAAYRALASKLHPDRQNGSGSVGDAAHDEMVALNAAYEVLIDPRQRATYDASLLAASAPPPAAPRASGHPFARTRPSPLSEPEDFGNTRVDMDWLTPLAEEERPRWPPSPKVLIMAGVGAGMLITIMGIWIWQVQVQTQMDRALSDQYAARPPVLAVAASALHLPGTNKASAPKVDAPPHTATSTVAEVAPVVAATVTSRRPTVEELARLSDEELVRVLPTLDLPTQQQVVRQREENHMLDGRPMRLRTERLLVDPLAPEPVSSTADR